MIAREESLTELMRLRHSDDCELKLGSRLVTD